MKTKTFIISCCIGMSVLSLLSLLGACLKEEQILTPQEENILFDFEVAPISRAEMIEIRRKVGVISIKESNKMKSRIDTTWSGIVIDPFITVGEEIRNNLIKKIETNDFPDDVISSREDIQFILQADSVQLATLGFTYSALSLAVEENETGVDKSEITITLVGECLFQTTGIPAIKAIVSSTKALMTKQAAVKLFKILAKRYIGGYLSLAWAVIDFLDCLGLTE